ncbi:MAG: hypothetical protein ACTJIB_11625 [Pseudoalteromonas prydzensis]|uniref:Lipoprotein n=1 Tax=Pseudoalteromonas prydzensis TaxID=182141 RepID=A0ABR9FNX4_9GAMM|nr:hypothetical protein [Pseudoalteromonas prydzensis]MBE0458519.1 hypothetical protein [Pseudoalteromonas prydzensis]
MKYLTITLVAAFPVGCASTMTTAGVGQTYNHVGAKVTSPNEPNWYLMKHTDPSVVFGKEYPDKSETAIANTYLFWIGEFPTGREFFDQVIESRKTFDNKARFKQLELDYETLTFKGRPCLKYSGLAEDHEDKGLDSKEFQYFKNQGYICRTNLNQTTALLMEVSHRSDTKTFPQNLNNVAQEFFNNIELTTY